MRISDQITFAGEGRLDRLAELRGQTLAELGVRHTDRIVVLPVWRGKVLVRDEAASIALATVEPAHGVVSSDLDRAILLGRCQGRIWMALDMSAWQPAEPDATLGAFNDPSRQIHPDLPDGTAFAELRMIMAQMSPEDAHLAATAKSILGWHQSHLFCAKCGQPSLPAQSGWQRNCPACGTQHFPRTDPVVIMLVTHGHDLLLGRSPGWPDGMFSLLAGFVEPGETIEDAVRREVAEETAVRIGDVRYVASQPWPYPSSLMVGCNATALTRDITVDPKELEDAMWISRGDLAEVFAGTSTRMRAPRKGAIAEFLMHNWLAGRIG